MNETRPIHFLLVEDDDGHAAITTRSLHLSRPTHRVDRVADGAEAIEFLRDPAKDRPDVILLDLNLPKVDGHEVLEMVKSDPALCKIPVVVLSTSDADSDRDRAYGKHANSYLVKPVDFDRFRQLVRELSLYWGVWNRPPNGDAASWQPGGSYGW